MTATKTMHLTATAANPHLEEAAIHIEAVQSEVTAAVAAVVKDTIAMSKLDEIAAAVLAVIKDTIEISKLDKVAAAVATYKPITKRDLARIQNMPAVVDQPCIDIYRTMRELEPDASPISYICNVYAWGYLQGKRGVTDWHGQQIKKRERKGL